MKATIPVWIAAAVYVSIFIPGTYSGADEANTTISLTYQFKQPIISQVEVFEHTFQKVVIPGTSQFITEGEPVLPVLTARILIPFGEEAGEIKVVSGEKVLIDGNYIIEPGQRPQSFSLEINEEYVAPKLEIYDSSENYPKTRFFEVGTQIKRGYRILTVNLHPVTYIPKSGYLSYYNSLTLNVTTRQQADIPSTFRGLPRDARAVSNLIDNHEALATYPLKQ